MRWRCNLAVYIVEISTSEIKTLTDAELTALRREFVRLCFSLRINSQGKGLNMSCLPPKTDFRERESVHAFGELIVDGISITSRYNDERELRDMKRALHTLEPDDRANIISLYCDSKYTNSYRVRMSCRDEKTAQQIGMALGLAFTNICGGQNGIGVEFGHGEFCYVEGYYSLETHN